MKWATAIQETTSKLHKNLTDCLWTYPLALRKFCLNFPSTFQVTGVWKRQMGHHNRACQVLVYVLFDRRRWVTDALAAVRPCSDCRRSFIIAFDFNLLKIRLRLIGVTFRAAMTQKFFSYPDRGVKQRKSSDDGDDKARVLKRCYHALPIGLGLYHTLTLYEQSIEMY